jgi:type II secretory pathway pseudopilin PulG
MARSPVRRGFSLLQLLLVLAILGVVLALMLAAVQRAREAAQLTKCMNRLRQQGLAVLSYESVQGRLPPGGVQGPFPVLDVPDGVSFGMWLVLLPYIDQTNVAQLYNLDASYDDPSNQPAVSTRLAVLQCPNADPDRVEQFENGGTGGGADYCPIDVNPFLADIGRIDPVSIFEGALPVNGMVRLTDITDGTSNTLLLAEAAGRPGVAWASPMLPVGLRQIVSRGHGFHPGGTPVCLSDGSVHFLRDSTDVRILGRLATRAGGEVINNGDF